MSNFINLFHTLAPLPWKYQVSYTNEVKFLSYLFVTKVLTKIILYKVIHKITMKIEGETSQWENITAREI